MSKPTLRKATLLALAGILVGIGGCTESPAAARAVTPSQLHLLQLTNVAPRSSLSGAASAVIGPDGGRIVSPGGAVLTFPAGALAEPTNISIAQSSSVVGVEIEPHGLTFPAGTEPTLTLPYGGANVAGLTTLSVVYVDGGVISEVLPTRVSLQAHTLTATLPHFSLYAGAGN